MEERDQILIDRYLAGELTEAELRDLQRRREEDPGFDQEIRSLEEARNALRLKEREALKERFRSRDALLDKKKPEVPIPNRKYLYIVGLAMSFILIIVAWKFFSAHSKSSDPVMIGPADSLNVKYPPAVIEDTMNVIDSPAVEKNKEKLKEKKPDVAQKSKKGSELFADYFEPYKDAMMDPTSRGDDKLSPIEKFQKAYWEGEYAQAVNLFPAVPESYRANDNYRFIYANALLASGQTDKAIGFLKEVIENNTSRYRVESRYMLAVAYLKKEDFDRASATLDQYLTQENGKQKEKAGALRKEIK